MFRTLTKSYILVFIILILSVSTAPANDISPKISFWNTRQKGANIFNQNIKAEDIRAAKKYGITFIRLSPDKFVSSHRDFLLGNADEYGALPEEDLGRLKKVLDMFEKEKMPVVLTMLSLPGSRWKQNNKDRDDLRIWRKEKYRIQATLFWQNLTARLRNHPAIVGYNILNEPHPERIFTSADAVHINEVNQIETQKILHDFYDKVIRGIRLSDPHTPIILDSSAYADPKTFKHLRPHEDKNILYSFHMYEPYEYTNHKFNNNNFCYPGNIKGKKWGKAELKSYMSSVTDFQKQYGIPANRILVGEFGGHRKACGLEKYFTDLIDIFQEEGWHIAFYAFREDTWDGMDYELGNTKLPWSYWQSLEQGEEPKSDRKDTHPAISVIKNNYMN